MELTAPAALKSLLSAHTYSCRVSVILLSSLTFSSFGARASADMFTLFASCLLPRLVRCRSALAAIFTDAGPESRFVYFRQRSVIDTLLSTARERYRTSYQARKEATSRQLCSIPFKKTIHFVYFSILFTYIYFYVLFLMELPSDQTSYNRSLIVCERRNCCKKIRQLQTKLFSILCCEKIT